MELATLRQFFRKPVRQTIVTTPQQTQKSLTPQDITLQDIDVIKRDIMKTFMQSTLQRSDILFAQPNGDWHASLFLMMTALNLENKGFDLEALELKAEVIRIFNECDTFNNNLHILLNRSQQHNESYEQYVQAGYKTALQVIETSHDSTASNESRNI
jgi:hypothetical protein